MYVYLFSQERDFKIEDAKRVLFDLLNQYRIEYSLDIPVFVVENLNVCKSTVPNNDHKVWWTECIGEEARALDQLYDLLKPQRTIVNYSKELNLRIHIEVAPYSQDELYDWVHDKMSTFSLERTHSV